MILRRFTYAALLLGLLLVSQGSLMAQVSVKTSLDSATIMIGDHLGLNVSIVAPTGTVIKNIEYGNWADEGKVEILDISDLNTVAESPELLLQQSLRLTTFDTGYLRLPPLLVVYELNGQLDTVNSSNLGLTVKSLQVLEEAPIRDNKDIIKEQINWRDIAPYAGGLLILALAGWLFWRRSQRVPEAVIAPPPPPVPAHEIALGKLTTLEQGAIWKTGAFKEFQTELTYVLREYLENRYGIQALEATTPEIVTQLQPLEVADTSKQQLTSILNTADMVKFAKAEPPAETHPKALAAVKDFVVDTRQIKVVVEETNEEESNTSDA